MNTSQKIQSLENRTEKTTYKGVFKDFQTFGSSYKGKRYTEYERDPYNEYQNFLYKRALFGLKMYSQEEIKKMHWQKRQRIQKVHKRTQDELNLWKQEKVIAITNMLLGLFHKSPLAKELIEVCSEPDPKFKCKSTFKELSLSKDDIVERMLIRGILPKNFKELK